MDNRMALSRPFAAPLSTNQGVGRDAFIAAMRGVAATVSVVTVSTPGGRLALTVSSLVSISADPPLFSVCINRRSPVCVALQETDALSVHVLAHDQHPLADHFAGRVREGVGYDVASADWLDSPATGEAILKGAALSIHGHVEQRVEAGSHCLFIVAAHHIADEQRPPLLYWDRSYASPTPHAPTA